MCDSERIKKSSVIGLYLSEDIEKIGSGGGTRTPDTRIMIPLL